MNAYRIALILCRAAVIFLWCNAALSVITGVLLAIGMRSGWIGSATWPTAATSFLLQGVNAMPPVVIAIALQIFAPTLSAAMTGGAMLEGEAILSRRGLDGQESALARAGAGLILLSLALASALPAVAGYGYYFFTGGFGTGVGRTAIIYNLVSQLVSAALRGGVGFVLAFALGLRRLVKAA